MSTTITRARFKELLTQAAIGELFIELGWDHADDALAVEAGKARHQLRTVANKRGFAVLVHTADELPDRNLRQAIEKKVARIHFEHLLVFRTSDGAQQVWQLAIRRPHQPITFHETIWHKGQEPELLYQKLSGLFIPLEKEQGITLVDVRENVTREFEKQTKDVTKKFYTGFKQEHDRFLQFIEGLNDQDARKWYASLMLNRLMFIYFMQRRGFMAGDTDYLSNKLKETRKLEGKDKFYGFYRQFLRVLFHQGLGSPERSPELEKRIGKVPYLNGGLFDEHELEENNTALKIKDEAFEKLFAFFDEWNWTLDTRQKASGRDINPDVIGYIFEQYINDRAQMGAYYTKEDITDYIGKNTIIPWLFDAAKTKDAQAFKPDGDVWHLLRDDPDRYIYPSVRHGVDATLLAKDDGQGPWWKSPIFDDLPAALKKGLNPEQKDLWKIRKAWNSRAVSPSNAEGMDHDPQSGRGMEDKALPTEIWREVIERRRRYLEVRRKLVAGEVKAINDLITLNLDITQFAQDVIHQTPSSDLVWAFYDAIQQVTVLDPTCGSGAFLFAALGILEPLYEACLQRMQWFTEVDDEKGTGKKHGNFRAILARTAQHPSRQYFIYKSIILQNLYGVDIMPEAVEIAKLRLFLKLVSTVEPDPKKPSYGIEPLPDIDFNIRAGNTLVGFGTRTELEKGLTADIEAAELRPEIEKECDVVARAFERYKEIQLGDGEDYAAFHAAKETLLERVKALRNMLDRVMGKLYSKHPDYKGGKEYEAWKKSHKPFHWFAEYYGIVEGRGGFDVIIGNPPYVDYSEGSSGYRLMEYDTRASGNLYAYVMERSRNIANESCYVGLIVPMSITSIREFASLRACIAKRFGQTWTTNHAIRPQSLFTGVAQRVSILLAHPASKKNLQWGTRYLRLKAELRTTFENLEYTELTSAHKVDGITPKLGTRIERIIWDKVMSSQKRIVPFVPRATKHELYVKDYGETYWIFPFSFKPYLTLVKSYKQIFFESEQDRDTVFLTANSSLFYWYYTAISDCWHFGPWHLSNYPISPQTDKALLTMAPQLKKDLIANRIKRFDKRIGGDLYEYKVNKSKPILDEIDALLAKHYGLSAEELDFVINYDIKYRMGDALEGAADE
ncbi:MAG: Eco57I restriction-modification methylase domain-containing protein [Flavobacteriia bacterium]|nr:Eco57I restriction-modification methylase domain-containing protein [Flavobacteriia bacterium]